MGQMKRQDESIREIIDPNTGEIIALQRDVNTSIITKNFGEENYIKVYYDTFLATIGENQTPLSEFLIAIGKYMFTMDNMQIIEFTKIKKEIIARELGKKVNTIEHYITDCVKAELLFKLGKGRSSTYAVSPFIMSKAKSKDVQTLQLNYEAKRGVIEISKPDPKKEIEQLRFTGFEAIEGEIEGNE